MTRKISEIAAEIKKDWVHTSRHAAPYLFAMSTLDTVDDMFGYDSGKSIILYFLANAQTWRGEVAKRIKKELNEIARKG